MSNDVPSADLLVSRLAAHGVRVVFGYPGGQLTPVYDALARTPVIRHVLARHEQASAFMADGYARATGSVGVCLAVCGPGFYNAATPLAAAHTDSIPVVCLSGQVPSSRPGLRSGCYHENEQLAAARSFTKAAIRCDDPARVVSALDDALAAAATGRPGPVLLEVPVDVLRAAVPRGLPPMPERTAPQAPDHAALSEAAGVVAGWKRPLVLAGGGVISSGASAELIAVAERLGSPVFHTANGCGAIPASHPLCAGMPWARATSDLSNMADLFSPLWRRCDGLLLVGCRLTQLATGSWTLPLPASIVHVDIDEAEIGRHAAATGVVGDAAASLRGLLPYLTPRDAWAAVPPRADWRIPGVDVVGVLSRVLPAGAVICADVTRSAYTLMATYPFSGPRTFLHPAGAVAMGYGLPAALGARAAFPGRCVVAVVGDGGFQMSALELASSVQEDLPVVVVLVNDNCLSLIKATQDVRYESRHIAVKLRNPDFGAMARAFGVRYDLASTEGRFVDAVRRAVTAGVTTVVEVRPEDAFSPSRPSPAEG